MIENTYKGLIREYASLRDKIIFEQFAAFGYNREEVLSLIEEGRMFAKERKLKGKKGSVIDIGIDGVKYITLSERFDWDNSKVEFSCKTANSKGGKR